MRIVALVKHECFGGTWQTNKRMFERGSLFGWYICSKISQHIRFWSHNYSKQSSRTRENPKYDSECLCYGGLWKVIRTKVVCVGFRFFHKTNSTKKSYILTCVGNYRHSKVYNYFFDTFFELSITQAFSIILGLTYFVKRYEEKSSH